MSARFRYAVVGCGLMGAAAARHLANMTEGVALIGPSEPADKAHHRGVFASHYDEGRITRTIDPDPVWARLARNSIGVTAISRRRRAFPSIARLAAC